MCVLVGTEWSTSASSANTPAITIKKVPPHALDNKERVDGTGAPTRITWKGPALSRLVKSVDSCTIAIGALTGIEG
jgi:hypothetical protein